jgi:hypothetical protein
MMADPNAYIETFDNGPGGWFAWFDNARGPKPLEIDAGAATSRSPWWIDYNHAPPGAGYLHLLYMLLTQGVAGEHHQEVAGRNRFVDAGCSTNFTNARMTLRLKGELESKDARLMLLCQARRGAIVSGWLCESQPFEVAAQWSEQSIELRPDEDAWRCLGARRGREDFYGRIPLADVLADVSVNILLVLFPLNIEPMGPIAGDKHDLRPEKDYPVWRSRLPEGYVDLDTVRIDFNK